MVLFGPSACVGKGFTVANYIALVLSRSLFEKPSTPPPPQKKKTKKNNNNQRTTPKFVGKLQACGCDNICQFRTQMNLY